MLKIIVVQKKKLKQIRFDNKHVPRKLVNEIQMIFQDPVDSLDPRMTVEDIIQEGLKIQGFKNKEENHQKVVEMLEKWVWLPSMLPVIHMNFRVVNVNESVLPVRWS